MLITLHTWDKNKRRYVNPRYIVEVYDYDEGGSPWRPPRRSTTSAGKWRVMPGSIHFDLLLLTALVGIFVPRGGFFFLMLYVLMVFNGW